MNLRFLTAGNVDFFSESITLFFWIIGFALFAFAFFAGGHVSGFLNRKVTSLTENLHLRLDKTLVDVIVKGIVIAAAHISSAPAMPPFKAVVDAMVPVGDFNEISAEFAAQEGKFLANVFFEVLFNQILLSFAYFIPFILVDLVVALIETFLCDRVEDRSILKSVILYVLDLFTLFAVNVIVLRTGTAFPKMMLAFVRAVDISQGIILFLFLSILFLVIMFFVLRDFLSSDILVAIFGVNIAAALMSVSIVDSNRWYIFAMAIVCGLISKLFKRLIVKESDSFVSEASSALITMTGTALIGCAVFMITERLL